MFDETLLILKQMYYISNKKSYLFNDKKDSIMDDYIISSMLKDLYINDILNNQKLIEKISKHDSESDSVRHLKDFLKIFSITFFYLFFSLLLISLFSVLFKTNIFLISIILMVFFKPYLDKCFKVFFKTKEKLFKEEDSLNSLKKTNKKIKSELDLIKLMISNNNDKYYYLKEQVEYLDNYIDDSSDFLKKTKENVYRGLRFVRKDYISKYYKNNISLKKI